MLDRPGSLLLLLQSVCNWLFNQLQNHLTLLSCGPHFSPLKKFMKYFAEFMLFLCFVPYVVAVEESHTYQKPWHSLQSKGSRMSGTFFRPMPKVCWKEDSSEPSAARKTLLLLKTLFLLGCFLLLTVIVSLTEEPPALLLWGPTDLGFSV